MRVGILCCAIVLTTSSIEVRAQSNGPIQKSMERCHALASIDEQLQCFGEVSQRMDECKTKTEKVDQASCFASLAGIVPVTSTPTASLWNSRNSVDKLDGSTTVIMTLDSSDRIKSRFGQDEGGSLVVRCLKNQTEFYIGHLE